MYLTCPQPWGRSWAVSGENDGDVGDTSGEVFASGL